MIVVTYLLRQSITLYKNLPIASAATAESYIMYLCGYFVLLCTAVDAGSVHCCPTHFVSHLFLTVDCKK